MKRRGSAQPWVVIAGVLSLALLTGCGDFFPPINGGGSGGGSTANRVYIANQATNSIGGFAIGTGTLAAVNNSPLATSYKPVSMVVTPNNSLLYVGSATGGIFVYFINSDGSLTTPSTGSLPAGVLAPAMAVSPDGQWLIALDGTTMQLDIFQINASTGALTSLNPPATYSTNSGTWQPSDVRVSPDGTLIFAALGTAGDVVFTFNTTTGIAASSQGLNTGNTQTGDYGLAVSKTGYLYIARSGTNGGVAVFSIGSGGSLTPVTGTPFAAGNGTFSVALDSTGTYVYAANRTDGTISGYTIVPSTTVLGLSLTPLGGSPYTSGKTVQSIGIDSTNKYLLAAAVGGAPDLSMYSFDTTVPGKLIPATSVATGSVAPAGAVALALTH
jgi:6-phosphogluconolactonase (cycloisomerase 2 family)